MTLPPLSMCPYMCAIAPALTTTHPHPHLPVYTVISAIPKPGTSCRPSFSWVALKVRSDIAGGDEEQKLLEQQFKALTDQVINMSEDSTADGMADEAFEYEDLKQQVVTSTTEPAAPANKQCMTYTIVEMSKSVIKWLESADLKYKKIFSERIDRLASGDRTYALAKLLQGTFALIYESKLFGFRILWTPIMRNDSKESRIFLWFVSTHDKVSYCAERIDSSFSRMDKKPQRCHWDHSSSASEFLSCNDNDKSPTGVSKLDQYLHVTEDTVLLDPLRNTPLRVHTTSSVKLSMIAGEDRWTPPLRLTQKQQDINGICGSVLILGRSGKRSSIIYLHSYASRAISHLHIYGIHIYI